MTILHPEPDSNKTAPNESASLDFDESATVHDIARLQSRVLVKARAATERVVLAKHLLQAMSGLEETPYYTSTFEFLVAQERERRAAEETNARCINVLLAAYGDQ